MVYHRNNNRFIPPTGKRRASSVSAVRSETVSTNTLCHLYSSCLEMAV